MPKKKRIGLVTWIGGPNYGTVLQAYALYKSLQHLGFEVEIIRKYSFIWGIKKSLSHLFSPLGINILKERDPDNEKFKRIRSLQKESFRYSRVVGPFGYRRLRRRFDAFVCGSDQMWNVYNCFDPFFFLDFAGSKTRVSYAVSIGTLDIKKEYQPAVKALISSFKAISVREITAFKVLSELSGRQDISVLPDPVFLPGRKAWEDFAASACLDQDLPSAYVLCYILGRLEDPKAIIETTLKQVGNETKIVILPSGEYPEFSIEGATLCPDAGAREFVALFAGAAAVVTDSFHGTAFSLIFDKPVFNLKRFADNDPCSQNSRISDLLSIKDSIPQLRDKAFCFLKESLK